MQRGETGRYWVSRDGGERVRAFIPASLPPDPPLVLEGGLQQSLFDAALALGRLDGAAAQLPDRDLLIYASIRKEAVLC